jgi:hypothetical protein
MFSFSLASFHDFLTKALYPKLLCEMVCRPNPNNWFYKQVTDVRYLTLSPKDSAEFLRLGWFSGDGHISPSRSKTRTRNLGVGGNTLHYADCVQWISRCSSPYEPVHVCLSRFLQQWDQRSHSWIHVVGTGTHCCATMTWYENCRRQWPRSTLVQQRPTWRDVKKPLECQCTPKSTLIQTC